MKYFLKSQIKNSCSGHTDLSGHVCCVLVTAVVDLLVVVHPDLSQSHLVPSDFGTFGKGVRAFGAEHMANHRTGDDL